MVISELDRKTPVYVSTMSLKILITACLVTTRPLPTHDRKPLLLSPELAKEWINPETSSERAAEIAVGGCRPTENFHWYKDVGNVRNQGPMLIMPSEAAPDDEDYCRQ